MDHEGSKLILAMDLDGKLALAMYLYEGSSMDLDAMDRYEGSSMDLDGMSVAEEAVYCIADVFDHRSRQRLVANKLHYSLQVFYHLGRSRSFLKKH